MFTLYILDFVPDHVKLFTLLNPSHALTEREIKILTELTLYELTIAEQVYIDAFQPSLNGNFLANWSTYNKGSTGYIKKEEDKSDISLSLLNRSFDPSTIELHRKNNTGKKLSEETRAKMSATSQRRKKGTYVILVDVAKNKEVPFDTLAVLCRELDISPRTAKRWALDAKPHNTRSLKYPLVIIKLLS